jgi:EAL domain-containing protein (putative c-di-GMP-specific phosphodiesterase class I)
LGIRLSIDDFGTGYSSLAYLKRMPVDEIKIDKSFVMGMFDHKDDETIVRSTIDLGHNMGLKVVAEGVETEEMLMRLKDLRCDLAQGYHLSRPLPPEKLEAWLHKWQESAEAA